MYEKIHDILLKQKLVALASADAQHKELVFKMLAEELEEPKIGAGATLLFCECGYPTKVMDAGKSAWLETLLKKEIDFDHYREQYYCPKCGRFLIEIQN